MEASPVRTAIAVTIVLMVAVAILRRVEPRLVLALGATALFLLASQFTSLFGHLAREMTNEKTVVPICSAMGCAYVFKLTGCDTHLVRLLIAPVRHLRSLLIPAGAAICFVVNTAIVSQSSTAATVGPVLIPLLLASGVRPLTAGAVLLLGSSVGGELFNPGAVEILTLSSKTGRGEIETVQAVMPYNLLATVTAMALFWWLSARLDRSGAGAGSPGPDEADAERRDEPTVHERVNIVKALIPLLPLALLFLGPHFKALPKSLVVGDRSFEMTSISIAAAMVAGAAAAGLTSPRLAGQLAGSFFDGAGFAYAHVISLIITATVFAEGVKANGLIDLLAAHLSGLPAVATALSVIAPCSLAAATGSGIASAVPIVRALVPVAAEMHVDPVRLGALTCVAAQLGRTMSPVAAVVMMSAALSGQKPLDLVRRLAPALVAAAAAILVAGLAKVF